MWVSHDVRLPQWMDGWMDEWMSLVSGTLNRQAVAKMIICDLDLDLEMSCEWGANAVEYLCSLTQTQSANCIFTLLFGPSDGHGIRTHVALFTEPAFISARAL